VGAESDRVWFAAPARLLPRRRWTGIFPATLLAWHSKLAGGKYGTSRRRKPVWVPSVRSVEANGFADRFGGPDAVRYLSVDTAI
jgi:hypothetical protein